MTALRVTPHNNFAELAAHRDCWNQLAAGLPFLEWEWLESWWRHYGHEAGRLRSGHELLLLAVWEGDQLLGVAPWYLQRTVAYGNVIRFLGSGEVCGDYLSILSRPPQARAVDEAIADWLHGCAVGTQNDGMTWDLLELTGVLESELATRGLAVFMLDRGHWVETVHLMSGWRIPLPQTWEEYVERLSKSHRKNVRRVDRLLKDNPDYQLRRTATSADFDKNWATLVDLHRRRWQLQGQAGCFESRRFADFHLEQAQRLLAAGRLELLILDYAGTPIAAEYQFRGAAGMFAYQAGIHPDYLEHEPGRMVGIAAIQGAISREEAYYDLLRGDEPYKAHWRAEPRPLVTLRIVPNRLVSKWRYRWQSTRHSVKRWLKQSWQDWVLATTDTTQFSG
ncbi:MAG: GNAT family N-acetyltransferase [Pirellulales bacterium]|nr:GNAT family N-acetyltransferase [Pirellulales bacterium]